MGARGRELYTQSQASLCLLHPEITEAQGKMETPLRSWRASGWEKTSSWISTANPRGTCCDLGAFSLVGFRKSWLPPQAHLSSRF